MLVHLLLHVCVCVRVAASVGSGFRVRAHERCVRAYVCACMCVWEMCTNLCMCVRRVCAAVVCPDAARPGFWMCTACSMFTLLGQFSRRGLPTVLVWAVVLGALVRATPRARGNRCALHAGRPPPKRRR